MTSSNKPVFVDIGSFDGGELREAVKDGFEVHCFEPNPNMNPFLDEFTNHPDVFINHAAAWDKTGFEPMYGKKENDNSEMSCSLIRAKSNVDTEHFVMVPTIDTGEYLARLDKDIAFLKIDCEGAEYRILESILRRFDYSRISRWLVEDHEVWINDPEWKKHKYDVLRQIEEKGIKIEPWKTYGDW